MTYVAAAGLVRDRAPPWCSRLAGDRPAGQLDGDSRDLAAGGTRLPIQSCESPASYISPPSRRSTCMPCIGAGVAAEHHAHAGTSLTNLALAVRQDVRGAWRCWPRSKRIPRSTSTGDYATDVHVALRSPTMRPSTPAYSNGGMVSSMAWVEPAGVRVHVHNRRLVGSRVLSASLLRPRRNRSSCSSFIALRRGHRHARGWRQPPRTQLRGYVDVRTLQPSAWALAAYTLQHGLDERVRITAFRVSAPSGSVRSMPSRPS